MRMNVIRFVMDVRMGLAGMAICSIKTVLEYHQARFYAELYQRVLTSNSDGMVEVKS